MQIKNKAVIREWAEKSNYLLYHFDFKVVFILIFTDTDDTSVQLYPEYSDLHMQL